MARDVLAERAEIDRAIEGRTLLDAFAETAERLADEPALRWRTGDGWAGLTWRGYRERVRDAAMGLRALGFAPGDFGAIMARNRAEHVIADLAILHARGTPVSIYNTLALEQIAYVANHCEARVAFVEDAAFLERFIAIRAGLPRLERIVLMDGESPDEWVIGWKDLLARGREQHERDPSAFEETWRQVTPDDLVTLIYTSGTTGPPKAVMDTHRNIMWTAESFRRLVEVSPGDQIISYLPLAHAAERFATHWQGIVRGGTVNLCADPAQLLLYLIEVRPAFFIGVPRVWEKLSAGIQAVLAAEPDAARRETVEGAIAAGREVVALEQRGEPVPPAVAARREAAEPVLAAIRARIGLDRCRVPITGAAPISTEVIEFFHALGVRIAEVWGMSELTAPATFNPVERIKIGTVGPPLPGVEARLEPDGEILVRGGNVMGGYYKDPERTAEVLEDCWMRTGDVAEVDADGYYRIVDRKKELIITAGGKNISPANLEGLLKRHPLIGQACVIGDRRAFLSALIVLDGDVAPAWAAARGIETASVAELAQRPEIEAEVERAVAEVNERVSRVEQIKRFTILPEEWTAESEELTPTLKLKRRVVAEKHSDAIEAMYPAG